MMDKQYIANLNWCYVRCCFGSNTNNIELVKSMTTVSPACDICRNILRIPFWLNQVTGNTDHGIYPFEFINLHGPKMVEFLIAMLTFW